MVQIGQDFNQLGASGTRGAIEIPDAYFSGIVEDIIINENNGKVLKYKEDGSNIGEAKIRLVPSDWGLPLKQLKSAYPIEMNIQDFPLVGEQVIVFKAFNALFYSRKISIKRKLTENASPEISRIFQEESIVNNPDSRDLAVLGIPEKYTVDKPNTTDSFALNPNVRPVRSNIGDIIFQGRYGSAIRMGSSLFKDPNEVVPKGNILLTAGFWKTPKQMSTGNKITPYSLFYENINKDVSSLWMVEDQEVPFEAITSVVDSPAHLLSSPKKTNKYIGAQIFINSDRIILNSKENEISLFAKREINLSSVGAITLDTEKDIFLRSFSDIKIKANSSISLQADEITFSTKNGISYKTLGDYGINGNRIFIGKYGDITQPIVLGANLAIWLSALMAQLLTPGAFLTTTGPAIINPSILPILIELKNQLGTLQSPQSAMFNSQDNFVSITNK